MTHQSYLQQEILEQARVLEGLLQQETENVQQIAAAIRTYNPAYMIMAARGSSDNAARYGQYLFGTVNRLSVQLATPSLFTLYQQPPVMAGAVVIAISQSGQSPDIVSVVTEGRQQGALTIAITNDTGSPLAQAAEYTVNMHAGAERSVAATKTYTASLMAIAMLSAALADDDERWQTLHTLPAHVASITAQAAHITAAAERYRYMNACVVLSRGYSYGSAFEVALKLKELTYTLAEPYSTADFKHGPVALVAEGFPVLALIPEGMLADELTAFIADLKERGAELLVISAHEPALALAQTALRIPAGVPEWAAPLLIVVPGQLFALGLTQAKGYDLDQPRNIHKVTRTQ